MLFSFLLYIICKKILVGNENGVSPPGAPIPVDPPLFYPKNYMECNYMLFLSSCKKLFQNELNELK